MEMAYVPSRINMKLEWFLQKQKDQHHTHDTGLSTEGRLAIEIYTG
jgi:hypothetical protein